MEHTGECSLQENEVNSSQLPHHQSMHFNDGISATKRSNSKVNTLLDTHAHNGINSQFKKIKTEGIEEKSSPTIFIQNDTYSTGSILNSSESSCVKIEQNESINGSPVLENAAGTQTSKLPLNVYATTIKTEGNNPVRSESSAPVSVSVSDSSHLSTETTSTKLPSETHPKNDVNCVDRTRIRNGISPAPIGNSETKPDESLKESEKIVNVHGGEDQSAKCDGKSVSFQHLRHKYLSELEYMLREFQKLEGQLLGAKSQNTVESAGSKERREKLHSFILHLEETIQQIMTGCQLEENKKAVNNGLGENGEENIVKLEEHIQSNLLPVKVRLKRQLAAQQGAKHNPAGMPTVRGGMQSLTSGNQNTKATFIRAVPEPEVQPTQFGKPLDGFGSSLTKKLHGHTLGSSSKLQSESSAAVATETTQIEKNSSEKNNERPVSAIEKPKVLYGGMALGSTQLQSSLNAARNVHKVMIRDPVLIETASQGVPMLIDPVNRQSQSARRESLKVAPVSNASSGIHTLPSKFAETTSGETRKAVNESSFGVSLQSTLPPPPIIHGQDKVYSEERKENLHNSYNAETIANRQENVSKLEDRESCPLTPAARKAILCYEERRRLIKKHRKKKKKHVEQQKACAEFGTAQQPDNVVPKRVKKSQSQRGPRNVEYTCALCNETYNSTCDYNPWWALQQQDCPKCLKNQIPRIDISAPANAIEYHPALLAHADENTSGGTPTAVMFVPPKELSSTSGDSESDLSDDDGLLSDGDDSWNLSDSEPDDRGAMNVTDFAENEKFGLDYDGPKLSEYHASRLLILILHASSCPGKHKSQYHDDVCRSTKWMMLHVRDCPGTTLISDVCPFPWCRKVKHLLYHLVSCDSPVTCGICSPQVSEGNMNKLKGLNRHRFNKIKCKCSDSNAVGQEGSSRPSTNDGFTSAHNTTLNNTSERQEVNSAPSIPAAFNVKADPFDFSTSITGKASVNNQLADPSLCGGIMDFQSHALTQTETPTTQLGLNATMNDPPLESNESSFNMMASKISSVTQSNLLSNEMTSFSTLPTSHDYSLLTMGTHEEITGCNLNSLVSVEPIVHNAFPNDFSISDVSQTNLKTESNPNDYSASAMHSSQPALMISNQLFKEPFIPDTPIDMQTEPLKSVVGTNTYYTSGVLGSDGRANNNTDSIPFTVQSATNEVHASVLNTHSNNSNDHQEATPASYLPSAFDIQPGNLDFSTSLPGDVLKNKHGQVLLTDPSLCGGSIDVERHEPTETNIVTTLMASTVDASITDPPHESEENSSILVAGKNSSVTQSNFVTDESNAVSTLSTNHDGSSLMGTNEDIAGYKIKTDDTNSPVTTHQVRTIERSTATASIKLEEATLPIDSLKSLTSVEERNVEIPFASTITDLKSSIQASIERNQTSDTKAMVEPIHFQRPGDASLECNAEHGNTHPNDKSTDLRTIIMKRSDHKSDVKIEQNDDSSTVRNEGMSQENLLLSVQ